nr:MAG TPA: hypothetical protein [Caudoviricetes sp.]
MHFFFCFLFLLSLVYIIRHHSTFITSPFSSNIYSSSLSAKCSLLWQSWHKHSKLSILKNILSSS